MANNNQARNNAKETLFGRFVPRQEGFFADNAKAANDNQPKTGNVVPINKNKPSDDANFQNNSGIIDKTNVISGAFGTKVEQAQNNPGLNKQAAENVSDDFAKKFFSDQGQVSKEDVSKDLAGNDFDQDNLEDINDNESFDDSLLLRNQIDQETEDANVMGSRSAAEKLVFFPPIIIISFTIIEYICSLLIGMVGLVITFIPPAGFVIGMIIGMAIYFWKIFFNGAILMWSIFYDFQSEQRIKSLKDNSRFKKITSILSDKRKLKLLGKITGKGKWVIFSLVVSIFPLVDLIWPTSFILAVQASLAKKKTVDEYNKSIEENN